MDNYFALGPIIVDRLRDGDVARIVDQIASIEVLDEKYVPSKGVYVSMTGDEIGALSSEGMATQVIQVWTVTTVLFNARELDLSMGPQQEMGELIAKIHNLIAGWEPDPTRYGPFIRRAGIGPQYAADHWFYSLTFQIQVPLYSDFVETT